MNDIWTCIIRIKTNEGFRSHLIEKSSFSIGRTQEADLPILAPSVSRLHLIVKIQPGSVTLVDQKSANGTFVNDKQIEPGQEIILLPNDVVKLGTAIAEFQFMAVPKPFELMDFEAQKTTLLRSMDDIAKEIQEKAKADAEKASRQARLEADQMVSHAKRDAEIMRTQSALELQERKQALEAEFAKLRQEVQSENTQERLKARREADLIIAEAQKRIQRDYEESSHRMEQQLVEFQHKSHDTLQAAEDRAQALLSEAREEANRIRTQASEESRTLQQKTIEIHAGADAKAQAILAQAREEANALRSGAADELARLKKQSVEALAAAEATAKKLMSDARDEAGRLRLAASEEANKIQQDSLKKSTEYAKAAHERLQKELVDKKAELLAQAKIDVEKEREHFDREHAIKREMLRGQTKAQEDQLALEKAEIERLLVEKGKIQVDYDKLQGDLSKALKLLSEVDDLEKRRAQAERELNKFVKDREEGVTKVQIELKDMKEKGVVEYETRKRDQENELAKARLKSIEDAQKRIEAEEKKYEQTRKLRALEASQKLGDILLPMIGNLPADADQARVQFKQSIDTAVTDVLMKGISAIQMVPEAIDAAPVVSQEEKDKRVWAWGAGVAVVVIAVIAFFGTELKAFFEKQQSGENSYASKMIEQRRVESIYKPEMKAEFQATYADNVLYMKDYFETKTDPNYMDKWTLKLNDIGFLRDELEPNLSEEDIVLFLAKETNLVQRLGALRSSIDAKYLDEGLGRLRDAEEEDVTEIKKILKGEENYKKLRALEESYLKEFKAITTK